MNGHCCVVQGWGRRKLLMVPGPSDAESQFSERGYHAIRDRALGREFVAAAPQVLYEGVPGSDNLQRTVSFQPKPGLEPAAVGLDPVVRVAHGDVLGGGQQLVEHPRVRRRPVGGHFRRRWRRPAPG